MEELKYIIEDSTIVELLGVQNFTNDESAVLELVKNSYDARAALLSLTFEETQLIIADNGIGMDTNDIKRHWMHVGKSSKKYDVVDKNNNTRILAGSKGIGRFALSRLGRNIEMFSKKAGAVGVVWRTDWNSSLLSDDESLNECGTRIIISNLREKWSKRKVENLAEFISKTYNDNLMKIEIKHPVVEKVITKYFPVPKLGKNCLSNIQLVYDSDKCVVTTKIQSDEFLDDAINYCSEVNPREYCIVTDMIDELKASKEFDLSIDALKENLKKIGDFSAEMYFNINSTSTEMEKFLYKYSSLPETIKGGIVLYRNAFSISAYEGKKDWLGLGKRSRKSPAAASHPSGAWRVRENQLAGKVEIDKKINSVLQDLSNRQGLDENIYYQLFIEIILTSLKEFERYRQSIIRQIDVKNNFEIEEKRTPVSDKVLSNPITVSQLSTQEAKQLAAEIKTYRKESNEYKREKANVEERYKYDVRILNVLATAGLKASSIAHEMRNDRNSIAENSNNIILALKEYDMWDELLSPDKIEKAYKNVPYLIKSNNEVSKKIVAFMDTMLSEVEKRQFEATWQSISYFLLKIKNIWERDYAWVTIKAQTSDDIYYLMSEDIVRVVFDNLILNSIQQNENKDHLEINIIANESNDQIHFMYIDNGKGLDKKYNSNPRRILEVHETTRNNGHGLGMWIVNNTVVMSGGEIIQINGQNGFSIEFLVGGKI
ncbi:ATP-binding protein [Acetobacterium paludosum]|uniref:ATP-binding protein n=1 Tax=Acetobacterium paludosum TaxID=52693 RepID=A0A923HTN6_9FIRM|nr:ATP-binding protein [Acetobacterium paludosum]